MFILPLRSRVNNIIKITDLKENQPSLSSRDIPSLSIKKHTTLIIRAITSLTDKATDLTPETITLSTEPVEETTSD